MSLKIENLSIKLQKEEILHDVSLEIKEGEFVSLLGASGCGKTTLLKSIAGLLETEGGSISIDGQKMDHVAPEKRGTVIVFQDLRLFPHMTVEKNISFALQLKKVPKKEQKKRVEKLLEDVQLSGYGDRRMKEMSGGQLQRVALARALAAEPKVLLLDEPFSGLDEKLRMEMGALVKRLHQEWKLTTILVTHDKREALQMSDRIALMSGGRILQYASPEEIFYHPKTKAVAEYFGKTNYLRGNAVQGIFRCGLGSWKTDMPDGTYDAMIRPFSIRLVDAGECGTIEKIEFMGETAEISIKTSESLVICSVSGNERRVRNLKIGDHAGIAVNEKEVVYFQ